MTDRRGGASSGARLEQPAQQDQRDDRAHRLVVHVRRQAGGGEDIRGKGRDERIEVRGARANPDQRVHVGGAVLEAAPRSFVELLPRPRHDRQGEDGEADLDPEQVDRRSRRHERPQLEGRRHQQPAQEVEALERVHGPVGHEEHRAPHRDDGRDAGQGELPGERPDFPRARQALPLERILGRDRGRDLEACLRHRALQLLAHRHARHVVHGDRLGRLVSGGANHAVDARQRLLERQHARRVVELLHREGDAGLAAVVARRADGLDQLRDMGLAIVVVDGRLPGGEVDRRAHDAVRARERLLHRGGAGRAAHALDGKDDPRLTHGTCAATRPACGRPWRARPPKGPSACSSRSETGIRRARAA